jgi:hypothetical protein
VQGACTYERRAGARDTTKLSLHGRGHGSATIVMVTLQPTSAQAPSTRHGTLPGPTRSGSAAPIWQTSVLACAMLIGLDEPRSGTGDIAAADGALVVMRAEHAPSG